jgi:CheY-like chemotaxis protein
MNIAYVEDNAVNLALLTRVASMNQHTITSYMEGEIALEELSKRQFDLILMDIELAGEINGLQVVRELRKRGISTPIIAVTAYAMLGDRERCIEAGCTGYLSKPISIPETLELLKQYAELTAQVHVEKTPTMEIDSIQLKPKDTAPLPDLFSEIEVVKPGTTPIPHTPGPIVAKPDAAEPVVAKPVATEPVVAKPVAAEPVTAKPVVAEPVTAKPIAAEPVAAKPNTSEPVVAGPGTTPAPVAETNAKAPAVDKSATNPDSSETVK